MKWLKPTWGSLILLVLILALQGLLASSISTSFDFGGGEPAHREFVFGFGAPLRFSSDGSDWTCTPGWSLLPNLALSYLLACALARLMTSGTGFRRPGRVYGLVALVVVVCAFVASTVFSKWYWGYVLSRPPVPQEIHSVASVSSLLFVQVSTNDSGARSMTVSTNFTPSSYIAKDERGGYYCLSERLVFALLDRGMLPSDAGTSLGDLSSVYDLIKASGFLVEPDEGYDTSDLLHGVVIDSTTADGERLVLVGAGGGQVSNDHYPHYEFVFKGSPPGSALELVRKQRFFYDVAGIEGAEWYFIWPTISALGIATAFIALTLGACLKNLVRLRLKKA